MKCFITYDWRDGSIEYSEVADHETGTPAWLYHGLGICFRLPEREYDQEEIVAEFREEFGAELDALRAGFREEWDGHNHVGRWAGDPEEHANRLSGLIYAVEQWEPNSGLEIWDASDYYYGGLTQDQILADLKIAADTTDARLAEIAAEAQEEARVKGRVLRRMQPFVETMRDVARQQKEEAEA